MVLEAIILCMDNSDWTRNGDYHPSRWESEVAAANMISESKCEKNPENGIGVISMAGKRVEVHLTLTSDLAMLLDCMKNISLSGECDFITALNIATLTLKHRPNKNQKQRIILFVGSPIKSKHSVEEMTQMGKKLKKYNIAVDIISFGNVDENKDHLTQFLNAVNNANNSSIIEIPVGCYLLDSLFTSSIMTDGEFANLPNEGGVPNIPQGGNVNQQGVGMSQFERDMNMALQMSMEEERKKAQAENPNANQNVNVNASTSVNPNPNANKVNPDANVEMKPAVEEENEEDELEKARLLSMKEHEEVIKKQNEEEEQVKDSLLENQDFIKDILKDIPSADLNDEDVMDMMKKLKEEKKDEKEKESDKDKKDKDDEQSKK